MIGFCGALNFESGTVGFSTLKRMCGLHSLGCAFINKEYGVLCDRVGDLREESLQPVTLRYNGALYTAAIIADTGGQRLSGSLASAVLEGYFEEGDGFLRRLDLPYALALYDGRCGELLLAKGSVGDKPLFYTHRDSALYFASALRPLMRLWGGCVRVSRQALCAYLDGGYDAFPDGLLCDIAAIRSGRGLLCSRLGESDVSVEQTVSSARADAPLGEPVSLPKRINMRRALTDALFSFDYPQFDCFMPSLTERIVQAAERGEREICVKDGAALYGRRYAEERAERLGSVWDIEVRCVPDEDALPSKMLKSMERELDAMLAAYLDDPACVLRRLPAEQMIERAQKQKSIPLRIRKKGMLCQTAMWFEAYNLVLV